MVLASAEYVSGHLCTPGAADPPAGYENYYTT